MLLSYIILKDTTIINDRVFPFKPCCQTPSQVMVKPGLAKVQ